MSTLPTTMRAILLEQFGSPETSLKMQNVKAFGINHAEMHMRRGEWAESMPIIGIECVGVIVYAEYTSAPLTNVVPIPHALVAKIGWARLGEQLLIRGATSSFGIAAVKLAVHKGAIVSATSRKVERGEALRALGVEQVLEEGEALSERLVLEGRKFDKVLELVGNTTLLGSLKMVRRGGKLCLAGFLGGLAPLEFNPLLQMASGVHFSFFGSFVFGDEEFPLTDVPLEELVELVVSGKLQAEPRRVFEFGESGVREAHRIMEAGQAEGKMVVVVDAAL
ncbi:GroES-like protein [Mycena metata]|uniref:GroES-like protein n=1 Tax=Mycena metata TaxID=1033252 RepID=A0AAD7NA08_9AGAR|nr:GroES-like protein [Mycena metata]